MSCLCLTRNRRQWLPQAIECYRKQTYPKRELVIVADGAPVHDLLPEDDDSIRLFEIAEGFRIGDKRNFAAERARGEVLIHWDDDDYSAPERICDQVARLRDSGRAVTGYRSMRFTDGARWWLFDRRGSHYSLGTSLCYARAWWQAHPFRSLQIGEDNQFVGEAHAAGELAAADAGELMFARIHVGNTSPKYPDPKVEEWTEL